MDSFRRLTIAARLALVLLVPATILHDGRFGLSHAVLLLGLIVTGLVAWFVVGCGRCREPIGSAIARERGLFGLMWPWTALPQSTLCCARCGASLGRHDG